MNTIKNTLIITVLSVVVLSMFLVSSSVIPTVDNSTENVTSLGTVCNSVENSNECLAGPNLGPIVYFLWKFFFSDMPCGWAVLIIIAIFLIAAFGSNNNDSNSNNNSNNTTQQS